MTTDSALTMPLVTVACNGTVIDVLGTAHVSKTSAAEVRQLLGEHHYDAVAVELCDSRYAAISDPDAMSRMDLFAVIRSGKMGMVAAQLALSAYQQRLAEQFGIEPGAEQRAAIEEARNRNLPLLFVDRDIGITLKRISANVPWWKKTGLVAGLIGSVLSRDKVTEEEIEQLRQGDMLETTFAEFAAERRDLFVPLIDERDEFMAAKLIEAQQQQQLQRMLVVVGAGHQAGLVKHLQQGIADPQVRIARLQRLPPPSRVWRLIPWLIVALILTGFAIGFSREGSLGWQLILDWVLINGSLSAFGALLAGAHPLTVLTAFVAAPLTSLNPTIGAGMVTAAVETWLRKPNVGHFQQLRHDVTHWRGWWQNRVSRIFLIFLLSSFGSAAGTYIAGFRIFDRLMN
jgi:pheromone shutdown-related protein TraB